MAKRKRIRRGDGNPLDYISLPRIELDPQIKRGIFIVFILTVGVISLLSLFDSAGAVGVYLAKGLAFVFGLGKWIFPLLLLSLGYSLYKEKKPRSAAYLGVFFFIISFQALLHLSLAFNMGYPSDSPIMGAEIANNWNLSASSGSGGGYLGFYLASTFINILGIWASFAVTIALFLVSLMLMFNTTLSRLIGRESWFAKIIYFINYIFAKIFHSENEEGDYQDEQGPEEAPEETEEGEEEEDAGEGIEFSLKKIKSEPSKLAKEINKKQKAEEEKNWKPSNVKIDIPLDLLSEKGGKPTSGDIKANIEIIKRTLENFGIPVEMSEVNVGPTVTQYTFKPADGVKLSRITTLNNDLALSLAAHPIRIEAPIPGKSLVGIEVPNQTKAIVGLKEILSDKAFSTRKSNLMIGLGKDVGGKVWLDDLGKMPHLLVAGATNSGKSVCLNSIIVGLLYQNNPDDLKFILVDPKRVELPVYNGIPHLLTPVITDVPKTVNALKWCLNEMDRRFELLAKAGKRNIQSYNQTLRKGEQKMPYLIFIIDELADLMVAAARDVEPGIIRLAQMARAVGIHLILATQRPSVDVITGLIKANMPARIAFSVASGIDSRTILDSLGAEKLLGRGDMLFSTAELQKPKRIQGALIDDNEIRRIVNYIKEKSEGPNYVEGVTERQKVSGIGGVGLDGNFGDEDDLLEEAKETIINSGKASASYLQRRLSIGYARAARLLDLLEEAGVIGPSNGSKPRDILITKEQYENMIFGGGMSGVALHNREESTPPDEYLGGSKDDEGEEEDEEEIKETGEELGEEDEKLKELESDDMPVHSEIKNEDDFDEDDGKFFSR